VSGGLWNTVSLLVPQGYTLIVSVVAARILGPDDMGRQSFIAFAQISLVVILSSGMQHVLMRFVGVAVGRGQSNDVRRLLRWSWTINGLGALIGAGVLGGIAFTRLDLQGAWLLAAFACAAAVLHAVPSSLLRGLQQWRSASTIALVTGALGLIATVVVLALGGGIVGMFAVEAVTGGVSLVWAQAMARQVSSQVLDPPRLDDDPSRLGADVARFAMLSTFQALLYLVVWRRSEFFFLERYSTASEIAMYSVAFAAVSAAVQVPQGLAGVLMPAVAHLFGGGEAARIQSGFSRALRLLVLVSLPLTAGVIAMGPTVVELFYGEPYRRAGLLLMILAAVVPLLPLYLLATSLLYAVGKVRAVLGVSVVATVVNLGLDVTLIPGGGAVGAAAASVAAQGTAGLLLMAVASRTLGGVDWDGKRLGGCALASVAGGLAAAAVIGAHPAVPGAIAGSMAGVAVFAVLAVPLQILSTADADWLDTHAGHLGGGIVGRLCRPFVSPS
jgi:O-antigen/teichoic acid export membrane protein